MPPLARRLVAKFLGTGLLVAVVVGSGIAAQRLSPTYAGLQLLQNSLTTVFGLGVLILLFGSVSGAHFNPVVSAVDWVVGRRSRTGLSGRTSWPTASRRSSASTSGYDLDADVCTPITPWRPPDRPTHPLRQQ
jgi:Major intrinsic protein